MLHHNTIELTADGSHTIYVPDLDEHYHSVNGAVQEAMHVYIRAGLQACSLPEVSVLEIGFGTGLNAMLSARDAAERSISLRYTSIEKYPLTKEVYENLNYEVQALHTLAWNEWTKVSPSFSLYKMEADICSCSFPDRYDVVYYDAFGPDKQPNVWSQEIFDRIVAAMNPGGVLTTYCAKGEVRRMLQRAGLTVERLQGPPGKREMLRGKKSEK